MDDLEEAIRDIEVRAGVRAGFFDDLAKEDDWSFVIKSHALLESACAEMLCERSGEPSTIDVFSRLELSAKTTGKVAFLKAFGLLVDRERRFISALSELRNQLVHNAINTAFDLQMHVSALDKNQKKNFVESFGYAYLSESDDGKEIIDSPEKVLAEPKQTIWLSLKCVLALISIQIDIMRQRRKLNELRAKIAVLAFPEQERPK